jgi:predicted nucleotidyltransferase
MKKVTPAEIKQLRPKRILSSDVWLPEGQISPAVRESLLKIANEFYIFLGLTVVIHDITFTGSLANYNYTKFSDIDLHILVDYSDVDENIDLVRDFLSAKKTVWNDKHSIFVKGYEVELYAQDINEPHHSTGVYSILKNEWIKKPKIGKPDIDIIAIKEKTKSLMRRIDRGIQSPNRREKLDHVKEKIKTMRQAGLERAGEFSIENLAFKVLRRNGYLEKLYSVSLKDYDASLSLSQESFMHK